LDLKEMIINKAESLGWNVTVEEDNSWGFWQFSPAGEDFGFEVVADTDDLVNAVAEYFESFDTEEHVMMWVDAKRSGTSGVPSIRALCDDADEIDRMLSDLSEALRRVEMDYYLSADE